MEQLLPIRLAVTVSVNILQNFFSGGANKLLF